MNIFEQTATIRDTEAMPYKEYLIHAEFPPEWLYLQLDFGNPWRTTLLIPLIVGLT